MKKDLRRIWEIALVVLIVGLSVAIFIFRDRIGDVGEIGYLGLFVLCMLANATVLLPAPSLMIAASCALIMNPWLVAVVAALGSSVGELVGYLFGRTTGSLSPKFKKFLDTLDARLHNELLIVFVLALLPLPLFDVVGIYSGGTRINPFKFFIVCFAGKLIKMLVYTRIYDILGWFLHRYPELNGIFERAGVTAVK